MQTPNKIIYDELELYSPHEMQLKLHGSPARYRVGAWGRQSGKSTWGHWECVKKAWENQNHTYWHLMPTYNQARVIYRRVIQELWPCQDIMLKKNQTELRIKLSSGSQVFFKSGDNIDSLRTETLNGCVIDEMREQSPDLWPMVIQPMLRTTGGWAAFISTCNGYDHFYDMAERAKADTSGRWSFFHSSSLCNPAFTKEEYEDAKREMSEAQFAQEILAEFRDLKTGRAYLCYSRNVHERNECPWCPGQYISPHLPIIVGCDFNLHPMVWELAQERVGEWWTFDEIYLENSNTPEAAEVLVQKVMGHKPGVIVCGDATSKANQRAAAKSDYDILFHALTNAKINWTDMTPDSNPLVKDRVNAFNARLKAADGGVHFWHHPLCKYLKRDLERVSWKDCDGYILSSGADKMLTHASDAMGYPICALTPIKSAYQVGRLVVISR